MLSGKTAKDSCGTYPERAGEEILRSRLNRQRLQLESAFRKMAGLAAAEQLKGAAKDFGNIAVIEEDSGVISRRNLFNLNQKLLRFIPVANGYRVELATSDYDQQDQLQGQLIDLFGDDDTRAFPLNFAFPYFGKSYSTVYVNSDGNLTFEDGDPSTRDRSLGRLLSGLPRIGAFFTDLDVTRAGAVSVLTRADRTVITWLAVPEYADFGLGPQNTFQVRLLAGGTIEIAYQDINSTSTVAGISPGRLGPSNIVSLNASNGLSFTGAIAERFTTTEELDTVTAAQRFYETHEDAYDYLVFYNALGISAGSGVVAYEVTTRNPRSGYGDTIIDAGAEYGSPRRLQAVLNLGPLSQYPLDPNAILPARFSSRDTATTVLAHEAGHLFLAYASVRDPNSPNSFPMLGRQSAHWNFTFNSEASLLEGERILDKGAGVSPRFETVAVTEQYSPYDQYLMGFRAKEEVPSLFYVADSGINSLFPPAPQIGRTFDGTRRDVSVDDIIAQWGRRTPDYTVSQRKFRFGIVLIAPKGFQVDPAWVTQIEAYRANFETLYAKASAQRAVAEASLKKSVALSLFPAAGIVLGQSATANITLTTTSALARVVLLRSRNSLVDLPASVTVPAGHTQASFTVKGLREGVDTIDATPSDTGYEAVEARLQVLASSRGLKLEIVSGDAQVATTGVLPKPLVVKVTDINKLPYPGVKVTAVFTAGTVTPASVLTASDGTASFLWTPGAPPSNRLQFTIDGDVSVTATALGKPYLLTTTVLNAASFAAGLTPFGLHTIFGANLSGGVTVAAPFPWPGRVNDVEVLVNGRPQPLIYVSDGQINFYLADTFSGADVAVTINTPFGTSGDIRIPLRPIQPGIFFDAATGYGAILRQGEFLQIYATGLGPVEQRNGFQFATAATEATINGSKVEVLYAGLAPGYVGLYQVNARLPAGTPVDSKIKLIVNGLASNEVKLR